MNSVFFDAPMSEDARRRGVHDGQLFVFSPRPSSLSLCELARDMARQCTDLAYLPSEIITRFEVEPTPLAEFPGR